MLVLGSYESFCIHRSNAVMSHYKRRCLFLSLSVFQRKRAEDRVGVGLSQWVGGCSLGGGGGDGLGRDARSLRVSGRVTRPKVRLSEQCTCDPCFDPSSFLPAGIRLWTHTAPPVFCRLDYAGRHLRQYMPNLWGTPSACFHYWPGLKPEPRRLTDWALHET